MAIFALFIYMPKGMAQGFVEPTKHTRDYYPDEGFSNVTLFEIVVFGNENNSTLLQTVVAQLNPSAFKDKVSGIRVSIFYEKTDTSDFYDGDIIFDQSGNVYLFTNFNLVKPKFVQKFRITGDINTSNLRYGDKLDIKVRLGMGLDGVSPDYYYPEIQSLIYRGGTPSSVFNPLAPIVNIFPSPFVNVINVNLPKIETITITNLFGQNFYVGPSGSIETSNFPSGVYLVQTSYGIRKVLKN